jgi:hypothetical protein
MDSNTTAIVPFHYLVEPQPQLSQTQSCRPFHFLRLPIDIQLIVYEHCDLPTLFHLMRTCSRTRGPASKLFWANPSDTHWYHCEEHWLFENRPSGHPIIMHCPEFAHQITNIEVDLMRLEHVFALDEDHAEEWMQARAADKAQHFWARMYTIFPAVKRVVMTGGKFRAPLPPRVGEFEQLYAAIEIAVDGAPPHIQVQLAFDDGWTHSPRRYTLWRIAKDLTPRWQVVNANWTPTRVRLPTRKFSLSPLGDLLNFIRRRSTLILEQGGVYWLKIESYARYALNGVIHCPYLDCDATFTERGSWKIHLVDTNHSHLDSGLAAQQDPMRELLCFKGTPAEEQVAIEARQNRIDNGYRRARTLQRRVGCAYGQEGSEERRLFEEQFHAQLREENFARPGELCSDPEQKTCDWVNTLHMYYDTSHVHYSGK